MGQVISGADRAIAAALVSRHQGKPDCRQANSEFPSSKPKLCYGAQSRPDVLVRRLERKRRFGVTATERKFGETIASTRVDPSVVQPKSEGAEFFYSNRP
jgi:hypothetical protein